MADITDCKQEQSGGGSGASAKTPPDGGRGYSRGRQLAWFVALYCAGLLSAAVVVYIFRALLENINN